MLPLSSMTNRLAPSLIFNPCYRISSAISNLLTPQNPIVDRLWCPFLLLCLETLLNHPPIPRFLMIKLNLHLFSSSHYRPHSKALLPTFWTLDLQSSVLQQARDRQAVHCTGNTWLLDLRSVHAQAILWYFANEDSQHWFNKGIERFWGKKVVQEVQGGRDVGVIKKNGLTMQLLQRSWDTESKKTLGPRWEELRR